MKVEPKEALLAKCAGDTLLERAAEQRVRERDVREAFMVKEGTGGKCELLTLVQ